jgi:hypothetical protein
MDEKVNGSNSESSDTKWKMQTPLSNSNNNTGCTYHSRSRCCDCHNIESPSQVNNNNDATAGLVTVEPCRYHNNNYHNPNHHPPSTFRRILPVLPQQLRQLLPTISVFILSWWKRYEQFVQKHQSILYLYDDIISRCFVLFAPNSNHTNSGDDDVGSVVIQWREVLYGCMELHRIMIQMAVTTFSLSDHPTTTTTPMKMNEYGPTTSTVTGLSPEERIVTTTHLRFVLTIIQSIYPLLQEMIRTFSIMSLSSNRNRNQIHNSAIISYRQAIVRRCIEWLRFVIRFTLLFRHWKCILKSQYSTLITNSTTNNSNSMDRHNSTAFVPVLLPGVMPNGGSWSYPTHCDPYYDPIASVTTQTMDKYEQECQRIERNHQYIGKRTGRRIVSTTRYPSRHVSSPQPQTASCTTKYREIYALLLLRLSTLMKSRTARSLRIIIGELLYICRPVVQIETEVRIYREHRYGITTTEQNSHSNDHRLLRSWVLCLGMDILSLFALSTIRNEQNVHQESQPSRFVPNATSLREIQRRRVRLWLYLLRSPLWEMYIEGTIRRCSDVLCRLPLLGGLLRNYIYDYIYYWKFYRAEEG